MNLIDIKIAIVTIFNCLAIILVGDLCAKNPNNAVYIVFLTIAACVAFAWIVKQNGNGFSKKVILATRKGDKKTKDSLDEITVGLVRERIVESIRKRFGGSGWNDNLSLAVEGEEYFVLCATGAGNCSVFIAEYLNGQWIRGTKCLNTTKICGFKKYDPSIMNRYGGTKR